MLAVWFGLYSEHQTRLGPITVQIWHVSYHMIHLGFNAERDQAYIRLEYLIAIAVTSISVAAIIGVPIGRQLRFIGFALAAIAGVILLYLNMIAIGWPFSYSFHYQ